MIDAYEIKEYVEKQQYIIENLESFISKILFKHREKDEVFGTAIRNIIQTLKATSESTGGDEGWITWNMRKVQKDIEYVCMVLKIDARMFEGQFKNFEEKKSDNVINIVSPVSSKSNIEKEPKCKYCEEEFDKKEVQRIYGIGSMVDLGGFCSSGCYTANLIKNGNEAFKNPTKK